jgi:hypothetical protein
MLSVHRAIQLEFMGARAEAGRALNAFKIPAGTPERNLRQIDSLLADAGGADTAQNLAARVLDAAKRGDLALNTMVAQGAMARSRAIVKLAYTNSLLTSLGTPIRNVVGNTSAVMLHTVAHAVAPRLARLGGGESATQVGEATAMLHGYDRRIRDMFKLNPLETWSHISANGFEALRRDGLFQGAAPGIEAAAPAGIRLGGAQREEAGAVGDVLASRPLSRRAWGVAEDTTLGRVLDVTQMASRRRPTSTPWPTTSTRWSLHAARCTRRPTARRCARWRTARCSPAA